MGEANNLRLKRYCVLNPVKVHCIYLRIIFLTLIRVSAVILNNLLALAEVLPSCSASTNGSIRRTLLKECSTVRRDCRRNRVGHLLTKFADTSSFLIAFNNFSLSIPCRNNYILMKICTKLQRKKAF